ncbi:MAG TPA: DivIVA domain-containing protein [Longimicrobiales bacterium]|nr:DivIVA domain-containing protein [Longimicrobiales bacterium]
MIDLTPLEVRKKKGDFRKTMRGYDPQSVDDFLDLVADRLEQLVRENAALQDRMGSVETQVADYRDRERALTEALVTAQEMREQMRQQMEREVELKRREADADAEGIRSAAAQMREREEENIRRLRARQTQFMQSYKSFLERELSELRVMDNTLQLDAPIEVKPPKKKVRPQPAAALEVATPEVAAPVPVPEPVHVPEVIPMPEFADEPELEEEPEMLDLTEIFEENAQPKDDFEFEDVRLEEVGDDDDDDNYSDDIFDQIIEDLPESPHVLEVTDLPPEDKKKPDDNDDDDGGWVSTLLEGKG